MRIHNKHELHNYLANQRIAVIQKAHRNVHMQVQIINNQLVDKKIIEWDDEHSSDVYDVYSEAAITSQISGYNRIATSKDLRRILRHSLVTRNPQTTMEATKVLNSVSDSITKLEVERTMKNLNYIERVLNNADVDIGKYNALIEKLPQTTSRKEVIERCITDGIKSHQGIDFKNTFGDTKALLQNVELPASKRQAFLETALRRKENYKGQAYNYRELKQLSKDLEKYKTNRLDYETAIMENKQAHRNGYGDLNQTKTWIWNPNEKTRHQGMDAHDPIPLTEKFEVVNDVTGDVDYLRFPGDVENDHNNCSNICNCMCTYEINKG